MPFSVVYWSPVPSSARCPSVIHLDSFCVSCCKGGSRFIFFPVDVHMVIVTGKTVLSCWVVAEPLSPVRWGSASALCSEPLALGSRTTCCDYNCTVLIPGSLICPSSLFFRIVLATCDPLRFHVHFGKSWLISTQSLLGFDWIALNVEMSWGRYAVLTVVNSVP